MKDWRKKRRTERGKRFKTLRDRIYWVRFLGYVGEYRSALVGILLLIVLGGAVGLVLPLMTRYVLDYVVPRKDFHLLNEIILAGFLIYLLQALLRYTEQRLVVTFSMNLITKIRRDLFSHQLKLPLSYYEKNTTGKLVSKLTYSILMIKILVETFAYVCLRELVLIGMIVLAASLIDFRLTLVFLGLTPFFVFYIHRLNRYMAEVAQRLQTKNDQIIRILDRTFHSIKLFQIFGAASQEVERFETVLNQDKTLRIKRTLVYAMNSVLITLFSSSVILLGLWYGSRQIILHQLTEGQVFAYMICLGMLFRPVSEFVKASAYLQAGKIGIRTIFSVFENTSPIEEPLRPLCPHKREGRIEFRNVWFNYAKGRGGLNRANFVIEPGQKVLIVGRSGAGKSTLFNLLLRLYECERGAILIDGLNIRRMQLSYLRNYFSVITQDQLHIEDTVLNNIFFGSGETADVEAQLEKALEIGRKLEMNRFITSLEKRYGQKVDSSGLGYSRGELQKLAMMRAVNKDSPIILMDEPTASLDLHSERSLLKIIEEQFKEKTTLIISHRPLPELKPDWIVVLKHGWIENQGSHHYLMQHCKYYRQLLMRPTEDPSMAA